jgi:hypothetical protein
MIWIFVIALAGFVIYSIVTYWKTTPADATRWHRLWLSMSAAATAGLGLLSSWISGAPTTPPTP